MARARYEIMRVQFKPKDLIKISGERNLVAVLDAFGPDKYSRNIAAMGESYSSPAGERISLRPATTAESVLIVSGDLKNKAHPKNLSLRWLQIGSIATTREGVFANTTEADERKLKALLDKSKKVNGVYFCEKDCGDDVGFAPYETFEQETNQEAGKFAEGGLARILEHTEGSAELLREMASIYQVGACVFGFKKVEKPVIRVVGLVSEGDSNRLILSGGEDPSYGGYAFAVVK